MHNFLQELVVNNIFAFLLIFMRFGVALMIMPGTGDSFVSPNIRVLFAVAISFVLTPVLSTHLPAMPSNTGVFIELLLSEVFIGIFIGLIMRIMITALDTAGTIVSIQAGLSNASMFNPSINAETPIMSAVYSSLGVTLILVADVHHQMLAAVVDSYRLFPATGAFPDMGSISETISKTATLAFKVGAQLAMPFLVVGTLVQVGFGLLGRLMPQVQVFFLAMPVQIFLSLLMLMLCLSASIMYWLDGYETILSQSFVPG